MNLILDIGNTSTKLAFYEDGIKVSSVRLNDFGRSELENELSAFVITKAIISSTRIVPAFIPELLHQTIPFVHELSYKSRFPFRIDYDNPESLGTDRLAAVAGAYNKFPGAEILVIDAGTALTFEFLSDNIYKGGNISPGIAMRFKALNSFTDKLPLVSPTEDYSFPGRNTADAITAGVITGVVYEINEYIRTFEKNRTDYKIVLTGGDGKFIKERINHQIIYLPDIVTDGLNYILEYNAE
jgi:type III pantothenate kinase